MTDQLAKRTIEREGSFVIPYLSKQMKLLDVGCGPGSISLGLARHLSEGSLVGIDTELSQIDLARKTAQENNVTNVTNAKFQQASVYELPFEDESFDFVFGHAVFLCLSKPEIAMQELFCVCKKGGLIGLREGLRMGEDFSELPISDRFKDISQLLREMIRLSGSDPDIALRYKGLLHSAGFQDSQLALDSVIYDCPQDMELLKNWNKGMFQGTFGKLAVEQALITQRELDNFITKMDHWYKDPAAFSYVTWLQSIARKPLV